MLTPEQVERVAGAICKRRCGGLWASDHRAQREGHRREAEAAARELEAIWTEEGRLLPEGLRVEDGTNWGWIEETLSSHGRCIQCPIRVERTLPEPQP